MRIAAVILVSAVLVHCIEAGQQQQRQQNVKLRRKRLLRDGRSLSAPFGLLSESLASTSSLMMKLLDGDLEEDVQAIEDVPRISSSNNNTLAEVEDSIKEQGEKEVSVPPSEKPSPAPAKSRRVPPPTVYICADPTDCPEPEHGQPYPPPRHRKKFVPFLRHYGYRVVGSNETSKEEEGEAKAEPVRSTTVPRPTEETSGSGSGSGSGYGSRQRIVSRMKARRTTTTPAPEYDVTESKTDEERKDYSKLSLAQLQDMMKGQAEQAEAGRETHETIRPPVDDVRPPSETVPEMPILEAANKTLPVIEEVPTEPAPVEEVTTTSTTTTTTPTPIEETTSTATMRIPDHFVSDDPETDSDIGGIYKITDSSSGGSDFMSEDFDEDEDEEEEGEVSGEILKSAGDDTQEQMETDDAFEEAAKEEIKEEEGARPNRPRMTIEDFGRPFADESLRRPRPFASGESDAGLSDEADVMPSFGMRESLSAFSGKAPIYGEEDSLRSGPRFPHFATTELSTSSESGGSGGLSSAEAGGDSKENLPLRTFTAVPTGQTEQTGADGQLAPDGAGEPLTPEEEEEIDEHLLADTERVPVLPSEDEVKEDAPEEAAALPDLNTPPIRPVVVPMMSVLGKNFSEEPKDTSAAVDITTPLPFSQLEYGIVKQKQLQQPHQKLHIRPEVASGFVTRGPPSGPPTYHVVQTTTPGSAYAVTGAEAEAEAEASRPHDDPYLNYFERDRPTPFTVRPTTRSSFGGSPFTLRMVTTSRPPLTSPSTSTTPPPTRPPIRNYQEEKPLPPASFATPFSSFPQKDRVPPPTYGSSSSPASEAERAPQKNYPREDWPGFHYTTSSAFTVRPTATLVPYNYVNPAKVGAKRKPLPAFSTPHHFDVRLKEPFESAPGFFDAVYTDKPKPPTRPPPQESFSEFDFDLPRLNTEQSAQDEEEPEFRQNYDDEDDLGLPFSSEELFPGQHDDRPGGKAIDDGHGFKSFEDKPSLKSFNDKPSFKSFEDKPSFKPFEDKPSVKSFDPPSKKSEGFGDEDFFATEKNKSGKEKSKQYLDNPYGSDFIRLEVDEERFFTNKSGLGIHHIPLMLNTPSPPPAQKKASIGQPQHQPPRPRKQQQPPPLRRKDVVRPASPPRPKNRATKEGLHPAFHDMMHRLVLVPSTTFIKSIAGRRNMEEE